MALPAPTMIAWRYTGLVRAILERVDAGGNAGDDAQGGVHADVERSIAGLED